MKRVFWFGLVLLGVFAGLRAQSVEVYVKGAKVSQGDTLRVSAQTGNMVHAQTIVKNVSDKDLTFTAQKEANLPTGVEDGWCVFGECQSVNSIKAIVAKAPGESFDGATEYLDVTPGSYVGKDVLIKYTFSAKETPSEALTFYVHWIFGASVENNMALTLNGKPVVNESEIAIEKETLASGMLKVNMAFENTGSDSILVVGHKDAYLATNTEDLWCLLGNCWTSSDFTANYKIAPYKTIDDGNQYLEYAPNGYVGRESVVYYTFYAKENEFNRITFAIRWVTKKASANEGSLAKMKMNSYPNPAKESVRLSWEKVEGSANLCVRNVSGQLIETLPANGLTQVELNVASWVPGIYFYSIEQNGSRLGTGKLLVR